MNAADLRYQHLSQRASAKNLESKTHSFKTIINIQKIEIIIEMWENIYFIMSDREDASIKTIDIPLDFSIIRNGIKQTLNLQFKTIDAPTLTENIIIERNSAHLNQAQTTSLTMEQLVSLIGSDSYTSLRKVTLEGTVLPSTISKSPIIQQYLRNLRQNEETIKKKENYIVRRTKTRF